MSTRHRTVAGVCSLALAAYGLLIALALGAIRWRALQAGLAVLMLAVAPAAFLRLRHLDVTQFLDDQSGMMTLARGAFVHAATC